MDIENTLEDLEAHFLAQSEALNASTQTDPVNLVRVTDFRGRVIELTAPLMGRDFTAGFIDGGSNWMIIRYSSIATLQMHYRSESSHPPRMWSRKTFQEIIGGFSFPIEVSWESNNQIDQQLHRGTAISCRNGLLAIAGIHSRHVPLLSVGELAVRVVDKAEGLFGKRG